MLLLVAALAACSGEDPGQEPPKALAPSRSESAAPAESAVPAAGGLAKEGWFGMGGGLHARVEMQRVERRADRSVLKLTVTNLDSEPVSAGNAFGHALGDTRSFRIPLVDSVGRKLYQPLTDASGDLFASFPGRYEPGVHYEAEVHYPPIPEHVPTVTALTAGTTGEFTGIPVVAGPFPPSAPPAADGLAPGTTASLPFFHTEGGPNKTIENLYDITEGETRETTSSPVEEKIGLRADVLFAFNSAELSQQAKSLLDQVADETRVKADPSKPPVVITGHTDSKGDDAYNLKLSERRAQAVLTELRTRLGEAYKYQAAGRGETQLIAKEGGPTDAKARARNRRVEISYQIKQEIPGTATTTSGPAQTGSAVAPAAFRPSDGATVASRFARLRGGQKLRIDAKTFYRDGAYLVAVFDIVNEGPGTINAILDYGDLDYAGGDFTAFSVIDPATQNVYRAVRIGPEDKSGVDDYLEPGWATFRTGVDQPNRGFFYVPAPPDNVKTVTFDAGIFGKVLTVPIS